MSGNTNANNLSRGNQLGTFDQLRVPDKDAVAFLSADYFAYLGGSLGLISDHLVAIEKQITAILSGSGKFTIGDFTNLTLTGAPENPQIIGNLVNLFTNNLFPTGTARRMYGYQASVDVGAPFEEVFGAFIGAFSGGAGSNGTAYICGVKAIGGLFHNTSGAEVNAIEALVQSSPSNPGSSTTISHLIKGILRIQDNIFVATFRGISIEIQNTSTGQVGDVVGVFISSTIDNAVGDVYPIKSESVNTSLFDGDIEFNSSDKGVILHSPNGTRYRLTVDNAGVLGTEVA